MFELATAFIALFSAGIFLAHAVEAITPNEKRGTDARPGRRLPVFSSLT
jgi:hypothetical protein